LSQSFSKGKGPGVKNIKAILAFFVGVRDALKISLITTREAISSSVSSLVGAGGSQSVRTWHPLEENT
jgi:hypothetical protein